MKQDSDYGPWDFLDDVDGPVLKAHSRQIRPFTLSIAERVAGRLSGKLLAGLEVARAFERGECDLARLESTRIACWESLDQRSCDFQDPDVNAARLVLFAMYPDKRDENAFDTLHHFLAFANRAGLTDLELLAAMQRYFGGPSDLAGRSP